MEFEHVPVLFNEVMEALNIKPDGIYVDGTLGGGGHSEGICRRLTEDGMLIGVDSDREALAAAERRLEGYSCGKRFVHANYSDTEAIAAAAGSKVQGILLDLGVSSYQLDNPERGFSYMQDAPLDMRMDDTDRLTAYDIVNGYSRDELTRIIRDFFGNSELCELDAQGRIKIPQNLREYARISKDLVTTGAMNKVEVWSAEAKADFDMAKKMKDKKFTDRLKEYSI